MPNAYLQGGASAPNPFRSSVPTQIYGVAQSTFINRAPLFTRLAQAALGSMSFKTSTSLYRPRTFTFNGGGSSISTGTTTINVSDASIFQNSDQIEVLIGSTWEQMLITAVNTASGAEAITVTRAYAGTTAVTITDGATGYLLSNARTGGETSVSGISRIPALYEQWSQTFQFPVLVAGALNACTNLALPPGVSSMVGRENLAAMQNCTDDVETAIYYGRSVPMVNDTDKPAMAGFRNYLVTNYTNNPTNKTIYMPSDFTRDLLTAPLKSGGRVNCVLCPPDFMVGLTIWGVPLLKLDAGKTGFGVDIDVFSAPWLGGAMLIPSPLLRAGTFISLNTEEVRMRVKRNMFRKPRGSTGDADQADIIFDGALEIDNENHHAMVEGVTGYQKQQ
jgi:hypothetical protein